MSQRHVVTEVSSLGCMLNAAITTGVLVFMVVFGMLALREAAQITGVGSDNLAGDGAPEQAAALAITAEPSPTPAPTTAVPTATTPPTATVIPSATPIPTVTSFSATETPISSADSSVDTAPSSESAVGDTSGSGADYDAALVAEGEELFALCAACHGADARGLPNLGKDLVTSEFVHSLTDDELLDFIKTGRPMWDPLNTSGIDMPPRGGNPALTDEQITSLIAYIRTLHAANAGA